jgi:AcrR family transcriptional regulator
MEKPFIATDQSINDVIERELSPRELKSAETKERIYQSMIALSEAYGYSNIKIKDICKQAGVSTGSFYNFFNSKDDVLLHYCYSHEENTLKDMARSFTNESHLEKIKKIVLNRLWLGINKSPEMARLNMIAHVKNNITSFAPDSFYYKILNKEINAGKECGEFNPGISNEFAVKSFIYQGFGMLRNWASQTDPHFNPMGEMEQFIDFFGEAYLLKK